MAYYCVHKRGKAKPIGKSFKLMIENTWEMGVLAHMSKDGKRTPKHFPGMAETSMGSLFMDHHLTNKTMVMDKRGSLTVVNHAEQSGDYTLTKTYIMQRRCICPLTSVFLWWNLVLVLQNTLS